MGARFLISSQTLASSAATVTFSSIPATYTDLVLRVSVRSDNSSTNSKDLMVTLNNDTASNYSRTSLDANASAVSTTRQTTTRILTPDIVTTALNTANTFGVTDIYIPLYGVSQNKQVSVFGAKEQNDNLYAYINSGAGLWRNTATITSVEIFLSSANFVSGSTFYLYGISKTN